MDRHRLLDPRQDRANIKCCHHRIVPTPTEQRNPVQEAVWPPLNAHREDLRTCARVFLFTVARNAANDMFRRGPRVRASESISELTELPVPELTMDVISAAERMKRLELLLEAVVALPDRCREVVILRHLDGLPYRKIAERLGISLNMVKVHLVNGVTECSAFIRKQDLTDDGGAEQPIASKTCWG